MNGSISSRNSSNTVAAINNLITDLHQCRAWLASRDGHSNVSKIINILTEAIAAGRSDICQLILDSGRVDNATIARISEEATAFACYSGHLSVVQLLVSQCRPKYTTHVHSSD
jgi:hypothetical protein